MQRLRILTWHVHGNYLWYLSQVPHDFYLPVQPGREGGFGGRGGTFPFGENVHEVPAEQLRTQDFDCILFQTRRNYEVDQFELLSSSQQRLPRIYLEHDPPQEHPTNTRHWVDDPHVLLVHVTPFNALMWDNGRTPTRVIDHGVIVPENVRYRGTTPRGIVVVNHLKRRGRRLGADVFESVRQRVPLELVGMGTEESGGLGEIPPLELLPFIADYRFFFNPIRYTSMGLAVIEAMSIGMPIVALATTEMATAIQQGESGIVDTDVEKLVDGMQLLLSDPDEARRLGANARSYALDRFNLNRFVRDWELAFSDVTSSARPNPIRNTSEGVLV